MEELQAAIRAELDQEWEDLDADWRFYRWPAAAPRCPPHGHT